MTKYECLNIYPETKKRLDSVCIGKKTYDQLINELIEKSGIGADNTNKVTNPSKRGH